MSRYLPRVSIRLQTGRQEHVVRIHVVHPAAKSESALQAHSRYRLQSRNMSPLFTVYDTQCM